MWEKQGLLKEDWHLAPEWREHSNTTMLPHDLKLPQDTTTITTNNSHDNSGEGLQELTVCQVLNYENNSLFKHHRKPGRSVFSPPEFSFYG